MRQYECIPQDSCIVNVISNANYCKMGTMGVCLGCKGSTVINGLMLLSKKLAGVDLFSPAFLFLFHVKTLYSSSLEDVVARCQLGTRQQTCQDLDVIPLNIQNSVKYISILIKVSSVWYSVKGAQNGMYL
jgi:hypothetical protein